MRQPSGLLAHWLLAALLCCPAAALAAPANYQGLWWNAPAESESGWGLNLAHQGDAIFATWYTYDATGKGWWLSMTATRAADGTYAGTLIETRGPGFDAIPFDPSRVTRSEVGTGTLAFQDADNGTFTYFVKGVQQTKAITRQAFGAMPTCTYSAKPDLAAAANYQDLWWVADGAESGWGVNLAHEGDVIFATWLLYDRDGTPLWLSVTAPKCGTFAYGGPLIRTTGPAFGATPFDPTKVTRTVVGSATFTFANGNAANLAYTVDGVTRTKSISRCLFAPPAGTRCGAKQLATIGGKVFGPNALEQAVVCADTGGNGRCDPDEPRTLSDATGAYQLAAPEGFAGSLVAEIVAGQTRDAGQPGAAVDTPYRMASPGRDYSANITPYTTLVQLSRERDLRLAEEFVRNELGLPPGFRINLDAAPASGSLSHQVAGFVARALKSTAAALDPASSGAFAQVVAAFPAELTAVPQLHIDTRGRLISSREVYVDGTFTLVNPAASTPQMTLTGKIRGRGNVTWEQPKKPYKVQFNDDSAYAKVPDFLGMKRNRNWALLADHLDKSLIRNKLALSLANSPLFADGQKWSPSGQHLELWLNGVYNGVYLLVEDIRIDSSRLAIRKMSSKPADNQVDGGYIVEVDVLLDCFNDGTINLQHTTAKGTRLCIKKPDEESITPAQQAYIKEYIDATEAAIYAKSDISRINALSYADWYLLNELFRNQDAVFYSSDYMWKDTDSARNPADRLLNMGPIWDFDISAGNVNMYNNWEWTDCWVNKPLGIIPNWMAPLFDHPDFLNLTLSRWKDKRAGLERYLFASIDTFSRRLEQAQSRNFATWDILSLPAWNEYYSFTTYEENVAFLKTWLGNRMAWLDGAYASPKAFAALCK